MPIPQHLKIAATSVISRLGSLNGSMDLRVGDELRTIELINPYVQSTSELVVLARVIGITRPHIAINSVLFNEISRSLLNTQLGGAPTRSYYAAVLTMIVSDQIVLPD